MWTFQSSESPNVSTSRQAPGPPPTTEEREIENANMGHTVFWAGRVCKAQPQGVLHQTRSDPDRLSRRKVQRCPTEDPKSQNIGPCLQSRVTCLVPTLPRQPAKLQLSGARQRPLLTRQPPEALQSSLHLQF